VDGVQVGYASIAGSIHACVWCGTAASLMDLNPANFSSSARSISVDAAGTRIAGHGFNNLTGREEALVWSRSNCSSPGSRSSRVHLGLRDRRGELLGDRGRHRPLTYSGRSKPLDRAATFITSSMAQRPRRRPHRYLLGCNHARLARRPCSSLGNEPRPLHRLQLLRKRHQQLRDVDIITSGDGNADGFANGLDIQGIAVAVTSDAPTSAGHCAYDMNHDGFVNAADIQSLSMRYSAMTLIWRLVATAYTPLQ